MSTTVIILDGVDAKTKQRLDSFMGDFRAQTLQHPFIRGQRIFDDQVVFEVSSFDGRIHLGCIQSIDLRRGHGSRALDWLIDTARRHQVSIDGSVQKVGHGGLSVRELKCWYKAHGFNVTRQGRILFDPVIEAAQRCARGAPTKPGSQRGSP